MNDNEILNNKNNYLIEKYSDKNKDNVRNLDEIKKLKEELNSIKLLQKYSIDIDKYNSLKSKYDEINLK